ncbi:hypothetical protein HOE37_02925 [Candidatus Woesearchaeota archaeon]|jgi:hypothetical protein|nr:hypothetical protein [Candidatus Woesearchaeota archaeon]MBT4110781.1 hypothetical protein [Candidatus Woesearchaeota archaeon]MBT4336707.1 hypothetical protein [Candidatus Woesearchaeota archaeon]MBT4469544.1 hypothetical protein [Candidatus Woesearchaeota archaeon]MBT6743906.1 hypothetical protein [Candidatus Woesearchaeota archaeon]
MTIDCITENGLANCRMYDRCLLSAGLQDVACEHINVSNTREVTWLDFDQNPASQSAKCYGCNYVEPWKEV